MDRKKTSPRRTPRKRKKTKPSDVRTTVILLAVIFGVSAALFFGKALLQQGDSNRANTAPSALTAPIEQTAPAGLTAADPATVPETPASVAVPQVEVPSAPVPSGPLSVEPPAPQATTTPAPAAQSPAAQAPVTKTSVTQSQSTGTKVPVNKKTSASTTVMTAPAATVPSATSPAATGSNSATSVDRTVKKPVSLVTRPPDKTIIPKHKGTLIFVFDDAGNNLKQLQPFLKLPFPCTIAVLPGLQYSKEAANRIRAAGKDVILHQPMQALNLSVNPGPEAIVKGMSAQAIKTLLLKNLAEVGPVVGINNHEGSLITADRSSMEAVLDVVREQRIFFLDSRTNADTVAPILAREKNMTIWERAVFLDNSQDQASIIEAVQSGMKIAENKGAAIMIGHIWSNDLANILTEMYPELVSQGFSLSTIAEIATNGEFDE